MKRKTRLEKFRKLTDRFESRNDDVIVTIGDTELTRGELIVDFECDLTRSGRALTRKFKQYRVKSAAELASRMSVSDMYDLGGLGELAATLFGFVLIKEGADAVAWSEGEKLSTSYRRSHAQAKKTKKIRRRYEGNVVRFRQAAR